VLEPLDSTSGMPGIRQLLCKCPLACTQTHRPNIGPLCRNSQYQFASLSPSTRLNCSQPPLAWALVLAMPLVVRKALAWALVLVLVLLELVGWQHPEALEIALCRSRENQVVCASAELLELDSAELLELELDSAELLELELESESGLEMASALGSQAPAHVVPL